MKNKKIRITNKRAYFDYSIGEKFEAGISLTGAEVKSVKTGHLSLNESFVQIKNGEAWLFNAMISPYPSADNRGYDPTRSRKLLLHKNEILKLQQQTKEKGLTVVPISCYTKANKIKLEIALAKGKKTYEKRESLKRKDIAKEVERQLKGKNAN